MEKITAFFNTPFGQGIISVCKALLLLALAFIVAAIVKKLVILLINKTKLKNALDKADKDGDGSKLTEYIGKLVYLVVFLLFVPGIFAALGAGSIMNPVVDMLQKIWGYVPNIIAASIILVVGLLVAKLIRELLIPVFRKIKVDKLQEKAGIEVADNAKLSNTLAYIVYVLIVIPVVIIALQALKITAISDPAVNMLTKVIGFIPNIIIGILIIIAGVWVGRLAGQIVSRLIAATGVDKKLSDQFEGKGKDFVLSKVVGIVVEVVIIFFITIEGLSILKLDVLSNIGEKMIGYMPKILASVIILALAYTIASLISKFMEKNGVGRFAPLVRVAIYILAGIMIMTQLKIAKDVVFWTFIILLIGFAVAAALAFGLGGKDFAAKTLKRLSPADDEKEDEGVSECAAEEAAEEEAEETNIGEDIAESVDNGIDKITGMFGKKEEE